MSDNTRQPLSRREAKKHATRKRILVESIRLFGEQGYDQTTVEQIARAAGITKPTFFSYFATKSMVLAALSQNAHERFIANAQLAMNTHRSTAKRLTAVFEHSALGLENHEQMSRMIVANGFHLFLDDEEGARRRYEELTDTVDTLLADGRRLGEIRSSLAPSAQVKLVLSAYFGELMAWLGQPKGTRLLPGLQEASRTLMTLLEAQHASRH